MALPMEREAAEPDLAVLVGTGKGGRKAPSVGMGEEGEEASELPPGFESAAAEAFPDMDPAAYPALKRLIALCMESSEY